MFTNSEFLKEFDKVWKIFLITISLALLIFSLIGDVFPFRVSR